MLYLVATILLNVIISALFKIFPKYNINALQAIVVNYCVCVVTGSIFIGKVPLSAQAFGEPWAIPAMLMGVGFICIFNLIAYCTKVDGITTATIANKLSLVIPVTFSLIVYHEQAGIFKITGILLAFPAIYFASRVKGGDNKPGNLLLPAVLFAGGGLLDTFMNYIQMHLLHTPDVQALFTIFCFATAGCIGILICTFLIATGRQAFAWKNVVAGVVVGIPNYFSIYYFIRALNSNYLHSSASIPVMNIGILVASSLTAILVFRERANALRILGISLSIIAILLIAFGDK